MNGQPDRRRASVVLAILLAALTVFLAPESQAAEVKVVHYPDGTFDIAGGTDRQAWHIRYGGNIRASSPKTQILTIAGSGPIAYFTHGSWLRRIDAEKGIVTGRWRFPGSYISAVEWKDTHLRISVNEENGIGTYPRDFDFNPDAPEIPYWPTTSLMASSIAPGEAPFGTLSDTNKVLSEAENSALRDPLSPYLQLQLAAIYDSAKRPEAAQYYELAARAPVMDLVETFRVSAALDKARKPELATETFERAYASFWQQGNDPRLAFALLSRIAAYPLSANTEETRSQYIERAYRLGPWVEGAEYAWDAYAQLLDSQGKAEEAKQWRQRAAEARPNSLHSAGRWFPIWARLIIAALAAAVLFASALFVRYVPERRVHVRAERKARGKSRLGFFNIEYWNRRDRIAFLTIACAAWLACGLAAASTHALTRVASLPLGLHGNLGGPANAVLFASFPKGPERDLLIAMAYQHDRQPAKAEALYRQLPDFAESWNNLGAILKDAGKEGESREAFEHALKLDPVMAEASLNLGNPPSDLWTQLHEKYLPGRPMLATPSTEHFFKGIGSDSTAATGARILGGPLGLIGNSDLLLSPVRGASKFIFMLMILALIFALGRPSPKDVTQPPPKIQSLIELLVPGTAPGWGIAGGIILTISLFWMLQWISFYSAPGSVLMGGLPMPDILRSFGVAADQANIQRLRIPGGGYASILVVGLWAVNAFVVWRSRRYTPANERR